MNIPGFDANAALGPASQAYRNYSYDGWAVGVQLAQLANDDTDSDNGDCYETCMSECTEAGGTQPACEQQCGEACSEGGAA